MTPAINVAKKSKTLHKLHEYEHDSKVESYGLEAADKLNVEAQRVLKTLVVQVDVSSLVVAVLPVSAMLSMKHIAKAAGGKKASMAPKANVERSTGYVLGGVSPLGQRKSLPTYVDESAAHYDTIFISAGRRGLEIELAPSDLISLVRGQYAALCQ